MKARGHSKHLGFGLVARSAPADPDLSRLGPRLEELGYAELWANDGHGRSGLATLGAAARESHSLDLCLGVAPLSERTVADLVAEVAEVGLQHERLVLGLGTGDGSTLASVREGVAALRQALPDVRVAIAALGPRMCRMGGEIADVVLLNWAFPDRIEWSRGLIAEGAAAAGREVPRVACYVRTAVGPGAEERLNAEGARYAGRPRPYARLFQEQHAADRGAPGLAAANAMAVPGLLAPYCASLDSCVVRALPAGQSLEELIEIAEAAAALDGSGLLFRGRRHMTASS